MKINIILFFFFKKFKLKFIKILFGRYNKYNYPKYLYKLIKLIKKEEHIVSFQTNSIKLKKNFPIELASVKIILKNSFKWTDYGIKYFKDIEDFESFHRWKWIVKTISQNKISKNQYLWFMDQVIEWFRIYNFKDNKKNSLIWESYNASERICNILISSNLLNFSLPQKIKIILKSHTNYLLDNLEFFDIKTGNHIINNARALYLSGCYFNNINLIKISEKILINELPRLLNKDYMLNEGSTHYHFLIQSWLLEIYFFSKKYNRRLNDKLIEYIIKMNHVTNFFKKNMINFPKFGDISPDCTPNWINKIEISSFFRNNADYSKGTWNYLWKNQKIESMNYKNKDIVLNHSGFIRLKSKNQIIFFRSTPVFSLNNLVSLNHGHDDIGHFLYYYKKNPVLVDSGGFTYLNTKEKFSEFHNIPNTPSLLKNINFIKYFFLNCLILKTKVNLKYNDNFVIIKFSKKSRLFENFFLNLERTLSLSEKTLILEDKILSKSLNTKVIISFAHNINFKNKTFYLDLKKKENCNLESEDNLKINKKNSNLYRFDVISYGKKKLTNFLAIKFAKNNKFKSKLKFTWKK